MGAPDLAGIRCVDHPPLHFMHYNLCRMHKTFRVTPAMEAGLAHHVWDIEELVGILN